MPRHVLVLTLTALLASGCIATPAPFSAPAPSVERAASVTAFARLGGTPPRTVATVQPWRKVDIDHVEIALYQGESAEAITTRSVSQAELNEVVTFSNLRYETRYRVTIRAWSDAAKTSRIDNMDENPGSCTTIFDTTRDETVDVGTLLLTLRDKVSP